MSIVTTEKDLILCKDHDFPEGEMNLGPDPRRKLQRRRLTAAAVVGVPAVLCVLFAGGCSGKKPGNTGSSNGDSIVPAIANRPDAAAKTVLATEQTAGDEADRSAFRARALALSLADLEEVRRLADAGDDVAMVLLARRYEIGQGVAIDYFEADAWYGKAAMQGSSEAARCLDRMNSQVPALSSHGNESTDCLVRTGPWQPFSPRESASWFRQAAERGEPAAMVKLAHVLATGNGVDQDVAQAEKWLDQAVAAYRELAGKGDPAAMLGLAEIFLASAPSGDPAIARDEAEGIAWCKKAVLAKSSSAMLLLADLHIQGRGVEQDVQKAFELRRQAAEDGHGRAMGLVAAMFETGQGTPQDQIAAMQWYQRAARVGDVGALIRLGRKLATGEGVSEDDGAAVACFLRAIRLGDDSGEAACQVGLAFAHGHGVERNDTQAVEFFRLAAQRNHSEALFQLGQMFNQGQGVARDPDEAGTFFLRAAGLGHKGALQFLADAHQMEVGIETGAQAAEWSKENDVADSALTRADDVAAPVEMSETSTSWGTLTAVQGDASAEVEGDQLRLKFNSLWPGPGLSSEGEPQNPVRHATGVHGPRVLKDVTGDFTAAVTFSGPLVWDRPAAGDGVTTLPPPGGVSLLLWQDPENFARVDRVGGLQGDQFRYSCVVLMVKDGRQVFQVSKALENATVRVRLDRNGDRLRASLTANGGQSWTSFRSQSLELPEVVKTGVAAFSDAGGPLIAEFREFDVIREE